MSIRYPWAILWCQHVKHFMYQCVSSFLNVSILAPPTTTTTTMWEEEEEGIGWCLDSLLLFIRCAFPYGSSPISYKSHFIDRSITWQDGSRQGRNSSSVKSDKKIRWWITTRAAGGGTGGELTKILDIHWRRRKRGATIFRCAIGVSLYNGGL